MLLIIEALESPQDIKALRLARSTRLMGESINAIIPEAFAHKGQSELDDKAALKARELIEEAVTIWNKRGVSAAIAKIMLECGTQKGSCRFKTESASLPITSISWKCCRKPRYL